ncbi:MAG: FMN-binding protein [Elusimicrobia bacterium]|nr:FMN-binding protein [Elusimicrobiota bacterium]
MPDNSSGPLQEGIFTGSGMGFVGEVELEVHFLRESPDSHPLIGQIRTLQSDEVREYWNRVIKELKPQVIDRQSTDIDTLTGATESSRAFLEAVENAMDKAYETK